MSITKWSAATVYHLRQKLLLEHIENLPAWSEPGEGLDSIGVVPIFETDYATPLGNSGCWFRLRASIRKISNTEKRLRIAKCMSDAEEKGLTEEDNHDELAALIEEVVLKLKKGTPPTHSEVDVMFRDGWLVVASASVSVCDQVVKFLNVTLDKHFSAAVMRMNGDLAELGVRLFKSDPFLLAVDNIALGGQTKVVLSDKTIIDIQPSDYKFEYLEILQGAKEVKFLCVDWGGMSCKLKSDFTITGLDDGFSEGNVEIEPSPDDDDDEPDDDCVQHMQSRARAELFVTSIPRLLNEVAVHCGGVKDLPELPEQDPLEGISKND